MPYTFPDNIPTVATNWTESEQRKCVTAAQGVLDAGGTEQNAIFACIHNAGRTVHPGGKKAMSIFERLAEMFGNFAKTLQEQAEGELDAKAVWDTAYIDDLPDSCFLFIESGGSKDDQGKTVPRSLRHFHYKDDTGAIDLPHLRNAIARIPQSNAGGLDKSALQKRAQAILERANQGNKANAFAVYKQADGAYRWFGWVSNHFRDNDNPPEILSSKAHQDFVDYVDKTGKFPELWLWHVPGSRIGKADMVDFADGFLIESGLFDPGAEDVAQKLATETDPVTMSHGFFRTKAMDANGITDGYLQFEASITPQGPEANPWTAFSAIKEAKMPLSENKKAFLAKYLPAETIASLEGKTDELRKAAEAAGVDWKAVEGDPTGIASISAEAAAAAPKLEDLIGPLADAISERLQMANLSTAIAEIKAKADQVDGLKDQITALTKTVNEGKKSDDERLAAIMMPKAASVYSWFDKAASTRADTVLDDNKPEDKALKGDTSRPFLATIAELAAQKVAGQR